MTSDFTRCFLSAWVVQDRINFNPNGTLFTFSVMWLVWGFHDRVLSSTTPGLTTLSTHYTWLPKLLIVMLEIFRLLNSIMVCADPKIIALVSFTLCFGIEALRNMRIRTDSAHRDITRTMTMLLEISQISSVSWVVETLIFYRRPYQSWIAARGW